MPLNIRTLKSLTRRAPKKNNHTVLKWLAALGIPTAAVAGGFAMSNNNKQNVQTQTTESLPGDSGSSQLTTETEGFTGALEAKGSTESKGSKGSTGGTGSTRSSGTSKLTAKTEGFTGALGSKGSTESKGSTDSTETSKKTLTITGTRPAQSYDNYVAESGASTTTGTSGTSGSKKTNVSSNNTDIGVKKTEEVASLENDVSAQKPDPSAAEVNKKTSQPLYWKGSDGKIHQVTSDQQHHLGLNVFQGKNLKSVQNQRYWVEKSIKNLMSTKGYSRDQAEAIVSQLGRQVGQKDSTPWKFNTQLSNAVKSYSKPQGSSGSQVKPKINASVESKGVTGGGMNAGGGTDTISASTWKDLSTIANSRAAQPDLTNNLANYTKFVGALNSLSSKAGQPFQNNYKGINTKQLQETANLRSPSLDLSNNLTNYTKLLNTLHNIGGHIVQPSQNNYKGIDLNKMQQMANLRSSNSDMSGTFKNYQELLKSISKLKPQAKSYWEPNPNYDNMSADQLQSIVNSRVNF